MVDIQSERIEGQHGMVVPVPTSHKALPHPRVPDAKLYEEAANLRRDFVRESGMNPRVYTTLDKRQLREINFVYNHLSEILIGELSKLHSVDTCVRLYKRHEEFFGLIQKHIYRSIPDVVIGNPTPSTIRQQKLWRWASIFTEPIRWLMELAVKYCTPHGGNANDTKIDSLIAIAWQLYEWDGAWEHAAYQLTPHEITIRQDFTVNVTPTYRTAQSLDMYQKALRIYENTGHREWATEVVLDKRTRPIDDFMQTPTIKALNEAVEKERGYNMNDWVRFTSGLTDSFGEPEYVKTIRESRISSILHSRWKVNADKLKPLSVDYALSSQTIANVEFHKLRPVEYSRRDSRLIRRPIVLLEHNGRRLCIYGVETLTAGIIMFYTRFTAGRIQLPDIVRSGLIRNAMGRLQTRLGDEFRDEISRRCTDIDFTNETEKRK